MMKSKKVLAVVLALVISVLPLGAFALEKNAGAGVVGKTVTIENYNDFVQFASKCRFDGYSQNLTVELKTDIDLMKKEFKGIPIFCGTFKGNNHTIKGGVYGENAVGGIAGVNNGTIIRCDNSGKVNTVMKKTYTEIEEVTVEDFKAPDDATKIMDVGGIAGVSSGVIRSCENNGKVGYPHVGYNVGGVIGRQSGYVYNCKNKGSITGRKEVGGVIGQMEPYLKVRYSEKGLKQLVKELDKLNRLTSSLNMNSKNSVNSASKDISALNDAAKVSSDSAKGVVDRTQAVINDNVEELNQISITVTGIIDMLIPISEDINKVIDTGKLSLDKFSSGLDLLEQALDKLDGMDSDFRLINMHVNSARNNLDKSLTFIESGLKHLEEAKKIADNNGTTTDIKNEVENAINDFKDGIEPMKSAINDINRAVDSIQPIIDKVANSNDYLKWALTTLSDGVDLLSSANKVLSEANKKTTDLLKYLDGRPDVKFQGLDEDFDEAKYDLYSSLDNMLVVAERLNRTANDGTSSILDDLEAVNNQLAVVSKLAVSITEEAIEDSKNLEDRIEDISSEATSGEVEGKVEKCRNEGRVEGDLNVGGISGSMAVDYSFDKEDDIADSDEKQGKSILQTRAIVIDSRNSGNILSKKDGCGGIVGKMVLGYISNCVATGEIKSEDGSKVGGIAGESSSLIYSSWAKCIIDGKNYIGGITGNGHELSKCYAVPHISSEGAYVGGVSGGLTENGQLKDNYFVNDSLGGLDGISYGGQCEEITYKKLLKINNIPEEFKKMVIVFSLDDEIIDKVYVEYGDKLDEEKMPTIHGDDGKYVKWSDIPKSEVVTDWIVKGEYVPFLTTLSSHDFMEGKKNKILVEGKFYESDGILVRQIATQSNVKKLDGWEVDIPVDGSKKHVIRYLPENKDENKVKVFKDGEWKNVSTKTDGDYLVFSAAGKQVQFKGYIYHYNLLLLVSVIFSGLLIGLLVRYVLKKKEAGLCHLQLKRKTN